MLAPHSGLAGVDFTDANLRVLTSLMRTSAARTWGAQLNGANLGGANLQKVDLEDAELRGAGVKDANFGRANLHGADLRGVDLDSANIGAADLHNANLHDTKLNKTVDNILTQHEAWEAHKGGPMASFEEARLVGEYYNSNGVENREELAAKLGQRAGQGIELATHPGPAVDHYYSELQADFPPPLTRWAAIKETAEALVERVSARFSTPKAAEIEAPSRSTPALPSPTPDTQQPPTQSAPVQEKTPALNAELPPGWSVEQVAQNKDLAVEISQIQDPHRRAEAERLLSGIKQEAEARQPRKEQQKQLEKGLELEP